MHDSQAIMLLADIDYVSSEQTQKQLFQFFFKASIHYKLFHVQY